MTESLLLALALSCGAGGGAATAAPPPLPTVTLTLNGHRFTPDAVSVPAGKRVRVILVNQDRVIEEFDSEALDAEWKAGPGQTIAFEIGPLKPGAYPFIGEYHAETAHGMITARP